MAAEMGSHDPGARAEVKLAMVLEPEAKVILAERCDDLEHEFRNAPLSKISELARNPRALHSALYNGLCPSLPHAVGTYRGTRGTDLENAQRVVLTRGDAKGLKRTDQCAAPEIVDTKMDALKGDITKFWNSAEHADSLAALSDLTHRFFWIHPFIDGNGHVWRLAMIAMARQAGLHPSSTWRVATRPYGPMFSVALQKFRTTPSLLEHELGAFFRRP